MTDHATSSRRARAAARALALVVSVALAACDDAAGPVSFGWASMSAGPSSTCAMTSTQAAYCWGYGASGQLGAPRGAVRDRGGAAVAVGANTP